MAAPVTPHPPAVTRESVLARAVSLREKAASGELPYPDAILEANETFVARLEQSAPGSDMATLKRAASEEAAKVEGRVWPLGLATCALAVGAGVISLACPPVLAYAAAAGSTALAARLTLALCKRTAARADHLRTYERHLSAWGSLASTDIKVPAWKGPLTAGGLRTLTRAFPEEVKEFPYGRELEAEHNAFLQRLPSDPSQPLAQVIEASVAASRRPSVRRASTAALRLLSNACWIGGNVAVAVGQPWLGAGLMAGMVGTWGLRKVLETGRSSDAARTARSAHYWDRNIQAAPDAKAETIIFNGDRPRQPDPTIERSHEDVKIGGIKVPVRREEDEP